MHKKLCKKLKNYLPYISIPTFCSTFTFHYSLLTFLRLLTVLCSLFSCFHCERFKNLSRLSKTFLVIMIFNVIIQYSVLLVSTINTYLLPIKLFLRKIRIKNRKSFMLKNSLQLILIWILKMVPIIMRVWVQNGEVGGGKMCKWRAGRRKNCVEEKINFHTNELNLKSATTTSSISYIRNTHMYLSLVLVSEKWCHSIPGTDYPFVL